MRGRGSDQHDAAEIPLSDEALMAEVAVGCRLSFRRLMDRHARPMLGLATRVTGHADDADEIVQDCFLKIWAQAARWRPDGPASFSTWLYRVVMNAALDRRRRRGFQPLEEAGDPVDPAPTGIDLVQARQRERLVAAALDHIPPRQSQALTLYYFSELTAPEAARVLELSVPALEALLARGKKGLGDYLRRRGITAMGDVT